MSGDFLYSGREMARNLDPAARVLVFIDGQNAYKSCDRLYGHGACHPLLLAEELRAGRRLVGVRYYSGVHDPTVDGRGRSRTDRRHNLMRAAGVTVVERKLRYRWDWGFDGGQLPNPRTSQGQTRRVTVTPYQRPREKGIDLAIGLDVLDLALEGCMDVAVIVSSDTDLCEAARSTHRVTGNATRVSVEAAVFTEGRKAILLEHYDYTHQLRKSAFDAAQDSFDYSKTLDPVHVKAFAQSCDQLRKHFGS